MKTMAKICCCLLLALAGCITEVHQDRITLDPPVLLLPTGGSKTINVRFLSGKTEDVEWYSSAENVASVSGGEVKALAPGTSLITARTAGKGLMAECEVTVLEPSQMVAGVTLSPSDTTLYLGARMQFDATVLPSTALNTDLTWTSSVDSVATVGYTGYLVTWKEGSTVITVTTDEGGFSASCNVTVLPPFVHVESISIPTEIELKVGESLTVTPVILPEDATDKRVLWHSYDESIVKVSEDGVITGVSAGMMYIDVTAVDGELRFKSLVFVRE